MTSPDLTSDQVSDHPFAPGRGLLLVVSAGIIWGTIGPAVALVDDASDLTAFTVTAYRAVLAVLALVTAAVLMRQLPAVLDVVLTHGRRVATVGVLTATFQLLFFLAVLGAGVSVATVVTLGLAPVLLLALDSIRARRFPPAAQSLTVITALVGLVLVALVGESGPRPTDLGWGLLAAVGSGVAFALSAQIGAPLSQHHGAVAITTGTTTVAAVVLIPIGLFSGAVGDGGLVPEGPEVWLLIAYLGVVTMALAYVLLFAGLRHTPSSTAVVATLIEPVTAVLIAVTLLGENLTTAGVVGSLLILGAIASLGRRRSPEMVMAP